MTDVKSTGLRKRLSSPLTLGSLAVAIVIAKTGLGLFPEWRRFADATLVWPDFGASPALTEADATLVSNSAGAWLLGALGFRGPTPYLVGSLMLVVIAVLLPFLMPITRDGETRPELPRLLFVIMAGGAVAPVLLSWIGSYDALIVIAATIAALSRNRWFSAAGWCLLGVAHATVALVALALWLPMAWVTRTHEDHRRRITRLAMACVALAVGWLSIRAVSDAWGGSTDRWQLFRRLDPSDVLHAYAAGWPLVLFGALGVVWLIVLRREVRRTVPGRLLLTEAVLSAFVLPLVAVDETRITVLCLLASTLTWAAWTGRMSPATPAVTEQWRTYALAATVVPVIVVWQGTVLYPGWDLLRTLQTSGLLP